MTILPLTGPHDLIQLVSDLNDRIVQLNGIIAATGTGREIVTANRTYYVNNVTGDDENTGVTTGTAFSTINKAIAQVCDSAYWVNCKPTISVAKTGTSYDQFVEMRPWQNVVTDAGSNDEFIDCAVIEGDVNDPTHGTGVLVRPTTNANKNAVVQCRGPGARWRWSAISVDGGSNSTNGQGCYAAMDGAYLEVKSGDLGPVSDPLGQAIPQLYSYNDSILRWNKDFVHTSHIYGTRPPGSYPIFGLCSDHSKLIVDNDINFDVDPGYWIVFYADIHSYMSTGHNSTFSGTHPTGQRIYFNDCSRGVTRHTLATFPGDSWTSATGVAVDFTSQFNMPEYPLQFTFATLPTFVRETQIVGLTDSNTKIIGATITGTGANQVLAIYWQGSWRVLFGV